MAGANKNKAGYTPQEDSPATLFQGTGTPYLAIFNGAGKPIICQKNNLPIGTFVKSFEYVYNEDEEDSGEIMIETDNPNLLDHEDLQYYSELLLQWGYIFSDTSFLVGPPRKVIIIGNSAEFTPNGTTINLKIADAGILLKTVPANYYNNMGGFEDFVKDLLDGNIISEIKMIDYSNIETKVIPMVAERVVDNDTVVLTMEHTDEMPKSYVAPTGAYPVVYDVLQTPNQGISNQVGVTLLQYNAKTRQLTQNFPDKYRKVWVKAIEANTLVVSGISKNKYQQIKDWSRTVDGGPWSMDFRDGKLTIHNRATGRPVYKVYTYTGGNGELLNFGVDSEFVKSSVEISKSVSLNPEDKSISTKVVQGINNPLVGNIDGYIAWQQGYMWNGRGFQGGSGDTGLNHASNNRGGNQSQPSFIGDTRHLSPDGTPMSLMERHQEFFYQDITPGTKVNSRVEFANVSEAKKEISKNWVSYVTQEDINQWFSSFKTNFDQWLKSDNIGESIHELQNIPNYELKMKVKLQRQEIPDMVAAGIYMLQSGQTTEELVNQLQSGELDFSQMSYGSIMGRDGVDQRFSSYGRWSIDGNTYKASDAVQKVQEVVSSAGGNVYYTKEVNPTGDLLNPKYLKGTASFEVDIEIPIAGVRLLADPNILGAVASMGSDIEETITNQMTARGTFIGDPLIESGFNMQIQNVSNKYSGIWYTKKVTHRLTPEGGYLCDVEFVQRAVPVSKRIIESDWVHSDFGKTIHERAKNSLEKGDWQKKDNVVQDVQTKFQELDQSIAVIGHDQGISVLAKDDKVRADRFSGIAGVNSYTPPPDNYVEIVPEE